MNRVLAAVLLALICLASGLAAVIGDGNPAVALAPVAGAAVLAALWFAPVASTLLVIFLGLTLDTSRDAAGLWQSPVAPLGRFLMENLNKTVPVESLKVTVFSLVVGLLLVKSWSLRASAAGAARRQGPTGPVWRAITIALAATCGLAAYGVLRGGDVQMVNLEVQNFVLAIAVAYVIAVTFDRCHIRVLCGIVVGAACIKALMALWVACVFVVPEGAILAFATTHGDSMLFASAVALLVIFAYEGRGYFRSPWMIPPALALIFAGVVANNRRLAWMEIMIAVVTLAAITPRTKGKRFLARAALFVSPLLLVYAAAGWNSTAKVFAPMKLIRSVSDGKTDRSTLTRDVENFNLISTFVQSRLIGSGFGQPYAEVVRGDDISHAFAAYRYVPHNSVLWLWAAGGLMGFTMIWGAPVTAIFASARAFKFAVTPEQRVFAFFALSTVQTYMLQCWGDMGFGDLKTIFVLGGGFGVAMHFSRAARVSRYELPLAA
jgi:hypothetical protein